jgi:16S rRNA G966 N2-methylase RsmD
MLDLGLFEDEKQEETLSRREIVEASSATPYYRSPDHDFNLLCGDTFELLPQFSFRFDMIFADPPYLRKSARPVARR